MNKQEYQEYLQSSYWQVYRRLAYALFERKCWFCKRGGRLNLHHTKYYKTTFFSKKNPINNMRWFLVLCDECHGAIHSIQIMEIPEVYAATRKFRDRYYPNIKMYKTKKQLKRTLNKYDHCICHLGECICGKGVN